MKDFQYKTSLYSLSDCKDFIKNIAGNMNYAENEGILTACFAYLEEYETKLKKEYIAGLPILFKVRCIEELEIFSPITKNKIYRVIEEVENDYIVTTDYGELRQISKNKFKRII